MVTAVAGWCPEDKSADEAPVNKLGVAEDASEDTFKDSSVKNVLENELGSDKVLPFLKTTQGRSNSGGDCFHPRQ